MDGSERIDSVCGDGIRLLLWVLGMGVLGGRGGGKEERKGLKPH